MKRYRNLLLVTIFIFLELFFLYNPKFIINNFNKTLNICLYSLLPSMFISILISQILINLNFERYIPKKIQNAITKLFNISPNEFSCFLLSILSGYPNNAKLLNDSKNLNNIIHYTNFVNPIFLITTVGCLYLKDIKLAIIILLTQYISNFILGIYFRNKNEPYSIIKTSKNINFLSIYSNSLKNTIISLSIIFANILFFSVIISIAKTLININPIIDSLIFGLIEFSNGIYLISISTSNKFLQGLIITIIITFGSFSMHMQELSLNKKIRYLKYIKYRIVNIFLSLIIYFILFSFV